MRSWGRIADHSLMLIDVAVLRHTRRGVVECDRAVSWLAGSFPAYCCIPAVDAIPAVVEGLEVDLVDPRAPALLGS